LEAKKKPMGELQSASSCFRHGMEWVEEGKAIIPLPSFSSPQFDDHSLLQFMIHFLFVVSGCRLVWIKKTKSNPPSSLLFVCCQWGWLGGMPNGQQKNGEWQMEWNKRIQWG
jgi:hypothetical protein